MKLVHKISEKISIKKEVRQGDTISPKLFTALQEEDFKNLEWKEAGIKVNREYINILSNSDDIVPMSGSTEEQQQMIFAQKKLIIMFKDDYSENKGDVQQQY